MAFKELIDKFWKFVNESNASNVYQNHSIFPVSWQHLFVVRQNLEIFHLVFICPVYRNVFGNTMDAFLNFNDILID